MQYTKHTIVVMNPMVVTSSPPNSIPKNVIEACSSITAMGNLKYNTSYGCNSKQKHFNLPSLLYFSFSNSVSFFLGAQYNSFVSYSWNLCIESCLLLSSTYGLYTKNTFYITCRICIFVSLPYC